MKIPSKIFQKAKEVSKEGGRLYIVGGAVRDFLLGEKPHDFDLVVTGLTIEQAERLFGSKIVGSKAPVFLWEGYEVALARKEKKKKDDKTYQGFEFYTSPEITIEQDLKRRDFTINAMAYDILANKIIDPFGGKEDLKNGIIRAVNPFSFKEDTIRILRAARFASRYDFKIEKNTINIIKSMIKDLPYQTKEKLFKELRKGLEHQRVYKFIYWFITLGIMETLFPSLKNLRLPKNFFQKLKVITQRLINKGIASMIYLGFKANVPLNDFMKDLKQLKIPSSWYKKIRNGIILLSYLKDKNYDSLLEASSLMKKYNKDLIKIVAIIAKKEGLDYKTFIEIYKVNNLNIEKLGISRKQLEVIRDKEKIKEFIMKKKKEFLNLKSHSIKKIKTVFILLLILVVAFILNKEVAFAGRKGCCSHHGGICGRVCCDGTPLSKKCEPYYNQKTPVKPFLAIMQRVIDGDTISILRLPNFDYYKVRVYGIDCPELAQPLGQTAKNYVYNLLTSDYYVFRVVPMGEDIYSRLLGIVYFTDDLDKFDKTLETFLIRKGLAFVYPICNKNDFCSYLKHEQEVAKNKNIGVWRLGVMFPWDFRSKR